MSYHRCSYSFCERVTEEQPPRGPSSSNFDFLRPPTFSNSNSCTITIIVNSNLTTQQGTTIENKFPPSKHIIKMCWSDALCLTQESLNAQRDRDKSRYRGESIWGSDYAHPMNAIPQPAMYPGHGRYGPRVGLPAGIRSGRGGSVHYPVSHMGDMGGMGGMAGMGGGGHHSGPFGGAAAGSHGYGPAGMGSRGRHGRGPRRGGRKGPRMPPGVVADPRSMRSEW